MEPIRSMSFPNFFVDESNATGPPIEKPNSIGLFRVKDILKESRFQPFDHHRITFNALLFITSGEVYHLVGDKKIVLKSGECLFIPRGEAHSFDKESNYEGYVVIFSEEFAASYIPMSANLLLEKCSLEREVYKRVFNASHLASLIAIIDSELRRDSEVKLNIIGSAISLFILKIFDSEVAVNASIDIDRGREHFYEFEHLVEKHYATTRNVKRYAEMMSVSYTYLNSVCKKVSGVTAKPFIDNVVISEARRLLISTSLSSKEIAFKLGFNESSNFYKYFKKHTSMLPSSYRVADRESDNSEV